MGVGDITLYAIYEEVDSSNPIIDNISTTVATNSITVVVTAHDNESGIVKYEYSIDGGKTWIDGGSNNTYTFTGLNENTSYTVHVRVTNGVEKTATSNKATTTSTLAKQPLVKQMRGEVVITYPSGCGNETTCSYQENDGSMVTANGTTTVNVGEDGTIVATVTDGVNTVSSTYTVIRRNLYVSSSGSDTTGYGTIAKPYATLTKAYDSATSTQEATIYFMNRVTQTDTTNMDEDKNIVLTSYSTNGTINSLVRGNSLTDYMIKQTSGTLTLEDVTIDGNNVAADYGLISISSSTININGGATLQNGKSAINGGAVRIEDNTKGVLNLNGGMISNNSAPGAGAIQVGFECEANINSGTISNNSATKDYGGAIYSTGLINLKGGNITNNSAIDSGGGVAARDSLMHVYGGNVNNNTVSNSTVKFYNNNVLNGTSYIVKYEGDTVISSATRIIHIVLLIKIVEK